jgi:hypothetical protein
MRLRDATAKGLDGFSVGAAEYAWRPSPSPLAPLPLPRCGRGRGREHPHLPRSLFRSLTTGVEGGGSIRTFPAAPFRSLTAGVEGEGSAEQGRDTIQITPLPRCGRGAGGEGDPHLPRRPFPLPHGGSGRGRISGAGAILARSPLSRSKAR